MRPVSLRPCGGSARDRILGKTIDIWIVAHSKSDSSEGSLLAGRLA